MNPENIKLESSWKKMLLSEFSKPYFDELTAFLKLEKQHGQIIFPAGPNIFRAFELTPFENVKAVVLGQDPYHDSGQAHGLCFSVPDGVKQPPSLQNIFKELKTDCGFEIPQNGNLESWAQQGVLLLNCLLTVRAHQPASHHNRGWEKFTDEAISVISKNKNHVVFFLWGKYAQQKKNLIDEKKHLVLMAAHPSPFSAYSGFFGCKHFSKANDWLRSHNMSEINWQL